MSDMVTIEVVIPEDVQNMLYELLEEFQKETGEIADTNQMIAGAIRFAYMTRH